MLFPTVEFAIFFSLVLPLSWALMPRPHAWKPVLLAVSYAFYAAADWKFCLLLGGITVGNQIAARAIERVGGGETLTGRAICAGAVVGDLAVLGVFKYYSFFVDEINGTLAGAGLGLPLPLATIALPIGVSFFTFQAISYVVDVKRGTLAPAPLIDVGLYLSFFPHLVAGPIVRAREFLPQLEKPRDPAKVAVGAGVVLIAVGLIKKVAIADVLAREVVDPVFAVPEAYASADVLLALYGYSAQVYCDFSGYTDIAIGLALLLGVVFPQNFDRPYHARTVGEFWRRWHMTLSRFVRDFVFIPLGGSRGGRWRTMRNLVIAFTIVGLWHGAAWGFVLFGLAHGLYMAVESQLRGRWPRFPTWARWLVTYHFLVLAFVLFRAPDLDVARTLVGQLAQSGPATLWAPLPVLLTLAVVGSHLLPPRPLDAFRERVEAASVAVLAPAMVVIILLVAATIPSQGVPPFIYFAF